VWQPPARFAMTWLASPAPTEVELDFTALGPALTRVAVEHRGWEALSDAQLTEDCALPGGYEAGSFREGWARILACLGAAAGDGAILVNVGNMHTFATLVRGRRLYGLFEGHTGGMTTALIAELVGKLQTGALDVAGFRTAFDGHGAALDPAYAEGGVGPFEFVAVTGPNRRLARPLGYHEAAPYGDMMLAGCWGLVEGVRVLRGAGAPAFP